LPASLPPLQHHRLIHLAHSFVVTHSTPKPLASLFVHR
jgi:hypothetical protein